MSKSKVKPKNVKPITEISKTIKSNVLEELVERRETLLENAELLQKTIDFLKSDL